jgi:hypothetical protein
MFIKQTLQLILHSGLFLQVQWTKKQMQRSMKLVWSKPHVETIYMSAVENNRYNVSTFFVVINYLLNNDNLHLECDI